MGDDAYERLLARGRALSSAVAGPVVPLDGEWAAGLGHLVRAAPGFPRRLDRVIRPLDRLAEVRLSPDAVGFDGETFRWKDVSTVRVGSVVDLLSTAVIDVELDRMVSALPPVPGRRFLSRKALELVLGMAIATVTSLSSAPGRGTVPLAVVRRSRFGRTKELRPGLAAALLCATVPGVTAAILDGAQRHGIGPTWTVEEPGRRAAQVRSMAAALRRTVADRTSGWAPEEAEAPEAPEADQLEAPEADEIGEPGPSRPGT